MRIKMIKAIAPLVGFFALPLAAVALPPNSVTQIVSFGDSLSDAGNAAIATNGAYPGANYATRTVPGVPYPVGYYTDGTATTPATTGPTGLWVDQLAVSIGVTDPVPALAGGTNYAVGGALTGSANQQDMQNQIADYFLQHTTASPSSLYTFWGGANDIIAGDDPVQAADNISAEIQQVAGAGGKYFLWPNLPALGATPEGAATGPAGVTALNLATNAFNTEWSTDVAKLDSEGIVVVGVDVHSLFGNLITNHSSYGFTDTTDPAQGLTGVNPNNYIFWDSLHPTTEADSYVASLAVSDLAAVPEPASFGVLVIAGMALLGKRRRRISFGIAASARSTNVPIGS
jgi:phospholipase/lecithinase/hemolysin